MEKEYNIGHGRKMIIVDGILDEERSNFMDGGIIFVNSIDSNRQAKVIIVEGE